MNALDAEPETGPDAHYLEAWILPQDVPALVQAAVSLGLDEFDFGEEDAA